MDKRRIQQPEEEITRIRTPRQSEVLGVVESMLGGDRLRVKCEDGNIRISRIPGRLRKKVWIRSGDLVLIEPWITQPIDRGDVVFRYTSTQANWLRRKGFVKGIIIE